jgi:hypothetical protein
MIVKSIQKNVVESHDFKSEIATIDASEMRYISSLLRNNYSDTILATVRETWANAVDANAAAKSSTPIKISFPTVLASTYSVRDFGTGLSEQELFGLYTKYGRSSKRGDNSAIGGFGIGRFSPLSYTDSFTVVSCKDGEKIIISVYVDESGDTRFTKLAEESTTEPNGVEISVAVKADDINKFAEAAYKVLKFASAPFVVSGIDKEQLRYEWLMKNHTWGVLETQNKSGYYHRRQDGPLVVMGGISYPLNLDILSDKLNTFPIYHSLRNSYASASFVFFFPVGSLSLHHSRESLEYNEHTKKNIVLFVSNFEAEIKAVFQKSLDDINDVEKFMSKVNSISDNYVLQSIARDMPMTFNAANGDKIEVRPNFSNDVETIYWVNRNNNFRPAHKADKKGINPASFYSNSNHCILIADNERHLFAKARWIQKNSENADKKGFCVFVLTPEQAKAFLTTYTTCKRVFLSSTTQKLKLDDAKSSEARIVYNKGAYGYRPFIGSANLPQEGKFYYVKLEYKDKRPVCEISKQMFGQNNSYDFFTRLNQSKIIDQDIVYGVFDDSDISSEAVNVATLVEDYIKKQLKLHSESISKNTEINYRSSKFRNSYVKEIASSLQKNHALRVFFGEASQSDLDFYENNRNMMELFQITKTFIKETIDRSEIDAEHDALMNKYPLLSLVANNYSYNFGEATIKNFANYISLIDKQQN